MNEIRTDELAIETLGEGITAANQFLRVLGGGYFRTKSGDNKPAAYTDKLQRLWQPADTRYTKSGWGGFVGPAPRRMASKDLPQQTLDTIHKMKWDYEEAWQYR